MILSRNYASTLLLGIVPLGISMAMVTTSARAGGYPDQNDAFVQAAKRCAAYGPGYVDMGHGTCGRVHVRVESGTRAVNANTWNAGGATSSAALRSDGRGMVPGAGLSTHLRVRDGLESFSPFQ